MLIVILPLVNEVKCCFSIMLAEKSGNGYEEGRCKGPDNDDIGLVGTVHLPLYLSLLHLVSEMGPLFVLFVCIWKEISFLLLWGCMINGNARVS